jgi:hypothetical protein
VGRHGEGRGEARQQSINYLYLLLSEIVLVATAGEKRQRVYRFAA